MLQGEMIVRDAIISPDISTDWKTSNQFMTKQTKSDMKSQVKELCLTKLLKPMFPNL